MAYNPTYKRERTRVRPSSIFPMILLFIIIIGASFYGGMLWERMQAEKAASDQSAVSSGTVSGSSLTSSKQADGSSTDTQSEASAAVTPEATPEPTPEPFEPLVPKTAYADLSYFDDAVFVGDSVSSGLSYYGIFPAGQVLADTSVNFESVLYKTPFTDLNGNYVSTVDAVACRNPGQIYIMLGANGIEWIDLDRLMGYYETLITRFQEAMPNAVILTQSVTPVTRSLDQDPDRDLTNAKIDAFNNALYELCKKLEVYYLNVAEDFKDEEGYLPDEASPFDGLHFTKSYYQNVWLEYLRNHAPFQPEKTPDASGTSDASGSSDASGTTGGASTEG